MRTAVLHRLAVQEVQAAYRWYARRSRKAPQRFRQAVDNAVRRIESAAELGSPFRSTYHWLPVRRFPFVLYYQILNDKSALIYAVAHARRRPGYWLRRSRP